MTIIMRYHSTEKNFNRHPYFISLFISKIVAKLLMYKLGCFFFKKYFSIIELVASTKGIASTSSIDLILKKIIVDRKTRNVRGDHTAIRILNGLLICNPSCLLLKLATTNCIIPCGSTIFQIIFR